MQYEHGQCVIAAGLRYRAYALYLRVGIVRTLAFCAIRTSSRHIGTPHYVRCIKMSLSQTNYQFFIEFTIREVDCEMHALRTCETDDTRHSCTLTNSVIDIGHWTCYSNVILVNDLFIDEEINRAVKNPSTTKVPIKYY